MKISLCKAKCAHCDFEFSQPTLSDFAYGEFVFTGARGTLHAYFNSIDNPVWALLESVVPPSGKSTKERIAQGAVMQSACASLADPVAGQHLVNHFVCPRCQSSRLASWGGERTGSVEVPEVSFHELMELPEAAQVQRALSAFQEASKK